MSYLNWHVGMKVVCVNASPSLEFNKTYARLRARKIYTIRRVGLDDRFGERPHGEVDVWLEEVARIGDLGYGAFRFRPVQNRSTDIAIFTAMLTGAKEREPA